MSGRVLVYRTLGLGDLLTAVPAYRALRRAWAGDEVVLAVPQPLVPLIRLVDRTFSVLPTAELAVPQTPPPEVAVDLHGRGPESHRALLALQPQRLIAFANDEIGIPGPEWDEDEHEVERWCRLVRWYGYDADPGDLLLRRPAPIARGRTVVHPGASTPDRCWPVERFAAVALSLDAQGHDVAITAGPGERGRALEVAELAGLPRTAAVSDLGVLELASLVAHARLVVVGDTGVAHLASAFATPSVVLFGPVPPRLWGPPQDGPHEALWHALVERRPSSVVDTALLAIGVGEVLDAVGRLGV